MRGRERGRERERERIVLIKLRSGIHGRRGRDWLNNI